MRYLAITCAVLAATPLCTGAGTWKQDFDSKIDLADFSAGEVQLYSPGAASGNVSVESEQGVVTITARGRTTKLLPAAALANSRYSLAFDVYPKVDADRGYARSIYHKCQSITPWLLEFRSEGSIHLYTTEAARIRNRPRPVKSTGVACAHAQASQIGRAWDSTSRQRGNRRMPTFLCDLERLLRRTLLRPNPHLSPVVCCECVLTAVLWNGLGRVEKDHLARHTTALSAYQSVGRERDGRLYICYRDALYVYDVRGRWNGSRAMAAGHGPSARTGRRAYATTVVTHRKGA